MKDIQNNLMSFLLAIISALVVGLLIGMLIGQYGGPRGAMARVQQALGMGSSYLQPPDAAAAQYRRQRLAFFRDSPAKAEIVMLGDSHTENGPWAELLDGYRVLNRGIGWDTTQDVLDRLDEVIARQPRKVFLLVGIVDLRYGAAPEQVAANIKTIAARLRTAGIEPVIQSVLPLAGRLPEPTNDKVRALNDELRTMSGFIDLRPGLATNGALKPELTHDGVHLLPPAYRLWAARIAPMIGAAGKL